MRLKPNYSTIRVTAPPPQVSLGWQINLPQHPEPGNTRKKKPASGWACCHIFPLFPHKVVSNTTKPPKPAKKDAGVSEAWNFFSRPAPAGESPWAGGLGEAACIPRVRRQAGPGSTHFPSPPRPCLRPSGPLHVGRRGLAPPPTAAARSRPVAACGSRTWCWGRPCW